MDLWVKRTEERLSFSTWIFDQEQLKARITSTFAYNKEKESPKLRATNKPPEPVTHSISHHQNATLPAPGGGPPGPPRRWRASLFNIYFYFFHRVHLLSPSCDVLRFFLFATSHHVPINVNICFTIHRSCKFWKNKTPNHCFCDFHKITVFAALLE